MPYLSEVSTVFNHRSIINAFGIKYTDMQVPSAIYNGCQITAKNSLLRMLNFNV